MTKFILGLGFVACACGASDDAISCAKTDRSGAYVAHFVERANGTCGAIPDTVLRFDGSGATMLPAGCTLDAPDVWSGDLCKLDRSYTCAIAGTDQTVVVVASTHETQSGGATIAGVESLTAYDSRGGFVCASTYDLTATRQ